jgi:hypothetical protein
MRAARWIGPDRERGAALVIASLIVTSMVAMTVLVTGRSSQAELLSAYQSSEALQALLSAETGLQRASKRVTQTGLGTPCGNAALNETITYPPGVDITITTKTTDFNGAALSATQCRIEASAKVTASNVTRKVSQIIDTALFEGFSSANITFDAGAPPTGWTLSGTSSGGVYYRTDGGSEAALPPCTTSAHTLKTGAATVQTLGSYAMRFNAYAAANSAWTVTYDRRYLIVTATDTNAANYVSFNFTDGGAGHVSPQVSLGAATVVAAIPTGSPPRGAGVNCSTSYTLNQTRTIPVTAASLLNPITNLGFTLQLRHTAGAPGSNRKEAYLDRLRLTAPAIPSGGTYMRILKWRECVPSPSNCP